MQLQQRQRMASTITELFGYSPHLPIRGREAGEEITGVSISTANLYEDTARLDMVTATDVARFRSLPDSQIRALEFGRQWKTTIDEKALAFTATTNLPPAKVYEQAIIAEL